MDIYIPEKINRVFQRAVQEGKRYIILYGGRGCIAAGTEIETIHGKCKVENFNGGIIKSLTGYSWAYRSFKFEKEKLFEVVLENGKKIVCTEEHKFLCKDGWFKLSSLNVGDSMLLQPHEYDACLHQRYFSSSLSTYHVDALHCLRILLGFLYHCYMDCHLYGEQPQMGVNTYLDVVRRLADGNELIHFCERKDDLEFLRKYICHNEYRLSSLFVHAKQQGKNLKEMGNCNGEIFSELLSVFSQFSLIFREKKSLVELIRGLAKQTAGLLMRICLEQNFQKVFGMLLCGVDDTTYSDSFCYDFLDNFHHRQYNKWGRIKQINYIGYDNYYDFFVPFENNYFANGFINHNSAKSWSVARYLIGITATTKKRILCAREIQRSIKDSVHKILADQISDLNADAYFNILRDSLSSRVGSEYIFKGLHHNSSEIKSTEGIDICWVEEGEKVTKDSLDVLFPTIRKENSLIVITFNPEKEESEVYQRFIVNKHPDAIVVNINFDENPFFPEVLRKEMEYDKSTDFEKYEHVWLGKLKKYRNALIFRDKFEILDFDTPDDSEFRYGADFGFSVDPSCLVRCFIKDECLWIDQEAYAHGIEIDELEAFYDTVDGSRKWKITADSARPDTISHIRKKGFNIVPSKKGKGSVEDGIEFLRAFKRIYIHSRCRGTIDNFESYRWKQDKITGEILPIPVDKNNHAPDALRYALEDYIKSVNHICEVF